MSELNMYAVNGTWYLRAEIAGRKYRESLHTTNVREARRLRDARLKVIQAQARHGAVDWAKAVVAWAEHMQGQIATATRQRYLQSLALCEPHLTGRAVGEIDGPTVRGLIAARRRVVGIATVRRDLTAVSRVLAYAQSVGWREGNPALDAIRTLRERRDPIALPDEDFDSSRLRRVFPSPAQPRSRGAIDRRPPSRVDGAQVVAIQRDGGNA